MGANDRAAHARRDRSGAGPGRPARNGKAIRGPVVRIDASTPDSLAANLRAVRGAFVRLRPPPRVEQRRPPMIAARLSGVEASIRTTGPRMPCRSCRRPGPARCDHVVRASARSFAPIAGRVPTCRRSFHCSSFAARRIPGTSSSSNHCGARPGEPVRRGPIASVRLQVAHHLGAFSASSIRRPAPEVSTSGSGPHRTHNENADQRQRCARHTRFTRGKPSRDGVV